VSKDNLRLGKSGEEAAVNFLLQNGYKILLRNYKTRLGEIDIIAKDKDTFCFVEVKTRRHCRFGKPQEAVGRLKQKKICQVALCFLKGRNLLEQKARFDVLAVDFETGEPDCELIKNAFESDEARYP
jgi:putative endonuclease